MILLLSQSIATQAYCRPNYIDTEPHYMKWLNPFSAKMGGGGGYNLTSRAYRNTGSSKIN